MAGFQQIRPGSTPPGLIAPISSGPLQEMTRYRALVARVVEAFGDEIKASKWLSLPNRDLNGQTPLQTVQNNGYDFQILEPVLVRIEHGVDY